MPTFQKFQSEITEKKQLTEKVIFLRLKLINPAQMDFQAGQFITVKISESVRRSYSIFNSPPAQSLDLIIDTSPGGEGSKFFLNAKIGQKVEFLGPLGKFVFSPAPETKSVYFVATGCGISPMHAMITDYFRRDRLLCLSGTINLLYGVSHYADLVSPQEYFDLAKQFPNFNFVPCISREKKQGCFSGRVTDYLNSQLSQQNSQFYICGAREKVADTVKILQEKGVKEEEIITERY